MTSKMEMFGQALGKAVKGTMDKMREDPGLVEQAAHGAWVTGGDAQSARGGEFLQARVAVRGHLAEVGDHFKAGAGLGQPLQDLVFDAGRHDLGVGAAAVEKRGGVGHREAVR